MESERWSEILDGFRGAGFPLAGVTGTALPERYWAAYQRWLGKGDGSTLKYMRRRWERRLDVRAGIPWARSVICVGLPYNTSREISREFTAKGRLWVSRYAWGDDYHRVVGGMLERACEAALPFGAKVKICVDSSAMLEKALAREAGLGFFGKNSLLINREWGSFIFLGEAVTDIDPPARDGRQGAREDPDGEGCGDCRRCMDACPRGAILGPGELDSERCIPAWNLEWKGPFPEGEGDLRGQLAGCDICQEACPYNCGRPLAATGEFSARDFWFAPERSKVLQMGHEEWDRLSAGSAIARVGLEGIRRNATAK